MLEITAFSSFLPNALSTLKAQKAQKILVLRFFGHGEPGCQHVGDGGVGNRIKWSVKEKRLLGATALSMLKGLFVEYGYVELRGCNVAVGESGKKLLRSVADLLQVDVVAGEGLQTDSMDVYEWENRSYHASPGKSKIVAVDHEKAWPPR